MTEKKRFHPLPWPEVRVRHPADLSDALSHELFEMGAGAVSSEEHGPDLLTVAGFPSDRKLDEIARRLDPFLSRLAEIFEIDQAPRAEYRMVEAEDWAEKWKEDLRPIPIGGRLVIKPTFYPYDPEPGVRVLEIDPGLAFGTGRHATTRLCLDALVRWISETGAPPPSVLDVGTGSGILALAAAALGSPLVHGVDNDPSALPVALENLEQNNLAGRVGLAVAEPAAVNRQYDLILANLTSGVLVGLAPEIFRLTRPGGTAMLSGILHPQEVEVRRAFNRAGFHEVRAERLEEWSALVFRRGGP